MEEVLRDVDVVANVDVLRDVDIVQGVVKDPPVPRPSVCQTRSKYPTTVRRIPIKQSMTPLHFLNKNLYTLIELASIVWQYSSML